MIQRERNRECNEYLWVKSRLHPEILIALSIPLSLNHATQTELSHLKGVSNKRAQLIVEGRPWKSVDQLTTIKGIGIKTLNRFSHLLSTQPPKTIYQAHRIHRLADEFDELDRSFLAAE